MPTLWRLDYIVGIQHNRSQYSFSHLYIWCNNRNEGLCFAVDLALSYYSYQLLVLVFGEREWKLPKQFCHLQITLTSSLAVCFAPNGSECARMRDICDLIMFQSNSLLLFSFPFNFYMNVVPKLENTIHKISVHSVVFLFSFFSIHNIKNAIWKGINDGTLKHTISRLWSLFHLSEYSFECEMLQ